MDQKNPNKNIFNKDIGEITLKIITIIMVIVGIGGIITSDKGSVEFWKYASTLLLSLFFIFVLNIKRIDKKYAWLVIIIGIVLYLLYDVLTMLVII